MRTIGVWIFVAGCLVLGAASLAAAEEVSGTDPLLLLLSRIQFAGTIMFHYLFPLLTIGLSVILVYLLLPAS
jgi:hypothetical protein